MYRMHWLGLSVRTVPGLILAAALVGCGGSSTGDERTSVTERTTLSVAATDADGDTLTYEWRVTAGTVDNRNASQTTWTLPRGPGVHFAYVLVSDGKGGYAQRQYAVNTDALEIAPAAVAAKSYPYQVPPPASDGTTLRIRIRQDGNLKFSDVDAGPERHVYLPDTAVRVLDAAGVVVFGGNADLSGEVNLPSLAVGKYRVECGASSTGPFDACPGSTVEIQAPSTINPSTARVLAVSLAERASNNLRLHGHISLADDSLCGVQDELFSVQTAATVQVLGDAGTPLVSKRRVNRFGDYVIQAAVPVNQRLTLRVECGSLRQDVVMRPDTDSSLRNRLVRGLPIESSVKLSNSTPVITRMVANGPEGSVRGREVLEEANALSGARSGSLQFLSFKGTDSALSACNYYRRIGAVSSCDSQGRLQGAITLDDWKRRHRFAPYQSGNTEVAATYINQRDLNLVRRMTATQTSPNNIAFVVCNNPGPEGRLQAEVDDVIAAGVANERRVACVAMEWSVTPGVNSDQPFTKFLTFGPDGSLIPSVNLDGRGEKFMPGACVACHGGSKIAGRFPETGNPSPMLGSRFLPFDTGNYLFSTHSDLTEASQGAAFKTLNNLVASTEGPGADTAVTRLVAGWYRANPNQLDKSYLPPAPSGSTSSWASSSPEKKAFYKEVVGASCRTCHVALGPGFDWDSAPDLFNGSSSGVIGRHFCGGTADLAVNGSMPNALASLNRLLDPGRPDLAAVKASLKAFIGCDAPLADPVFPRK